MTSAPTLCGYTCADGIATLTLRRPEVRNALNVALLQDLLAALEMARSDAAVVTVLTGAGLVFCAGADLKSDDGTAAGQPGWRRTLILRALELIEELPFTIAAVQGAAVGGGWAFALACDVCVTASGTRFSLPELALRLLPPTSTIERLSAAVGPAEAFRMITLDRVYSAEDLADRRLVEIVAADEFDQHVPLLAQRLAERDPSLLSELKATVRGVRPGGAQ